MPYPPDPKNPMCPKSLPLAVLSLLLTWAASLAGDLPASVSWIGNSFSGKTAWVQQDVEGLWVDGDGTLFTNVRWDEAGGNVQQYRDGQLIAMARHTHGGDTKAAKRWRPTRGTCSSCRTSTTKAVG